MPTVQAPEKRPAPRLGSHHLLTAAGCALLGVILLAAGSHLDSPRRADQLTVTNPHSWNARIEVSSAARDGWLGIGAVDRQSEQAFEEVIDQGRRWVFRFSYGDEETELVVDRADLEQADWTVTVPSELAERLRQSGTAESAG